MPALSEAFRLHSMYDAYVEFTQLYVSTSTSLEILPEKALSETTASALARLVPEDIV
jgi:hypothetical protein